MYYVCNILKWDQNRKWKITGGYELNSWKINTEIWYFKQVGFKKKEQWKNPFPMIYKNKILFFNYKRFDNFFWSMRCKIWQLFLIDAM